MAKLKNNFWIIISLFLLVTFFNSTVCAQPFGIMSQQKKSQKEILSSPTGRFVFGQISDSSKDKFMLDTFTGRLWRIAEKGDVGIFLKSVPYRISKGDYSDLPERKKAPEVKDDKP